MRGERRYLTLVLLLALLLPIAASAQITGQVVAEEDRQPLPGVIVTLRAAGEKQVLDYSRTDDEGAFAITPPASRDGGLWLHFSMLGLAPDSVQLVPGKSHYLVTLHEQVTELREVTVTAEPIHEEGDTIRYLVSNFSQIQDRSLAEVLRRMPGIEVGDAGQIKYQGVRINRFYIEGRDMLGDRYGVATNSINPKDVGSVEVLENHQPIKAIRDLSFSRNAALNIRLKEDAKSHWVGTADLGAGVMDERPDPTLLWDGKGNLMRFKSDRQVLVTARTTNTGLPASSINRSVGLSRSRGATPRYELSNPFALSVGAPYRLDEERYRKGPTHAVSTNNLWGLGEDIDLTTRLNYSHRTDESRNRSRRTYFFRDEDKVIESSEEGREQDNELALDATLLVNKEALYLKDQLSGQVAWDKLTLTTAGTYPNRQEMDHRNGEVTNDLSLIFRRGAQSYGVDSHVSWQRTPGTLTIASEGEDLRQEVTAEALFTNTSTDLSHSFGILNLGAKLGLATLHRTLRSDLTGLPIALDPTTNDLTADYLQGYLVPSLDLRARRLEGKLSVPLHYTSYRFREGEDEERPGYFSFAPSLTLDYRATRRLRLRADAGYSDGVSDERNRYGGYILSNYYALSRGTTDLRRERSFSAGIGSEYRNAVEALFADLDLRYLRHNDAFVKGRDTAGDFILSELIPRATDGELLSLGGSLSKSVSWWQTTFALRGLYSLGRQELYLQEQLTPFHYRSGTLRGSVSGHPLAWLNVTYSASFRSSREAMEESDGHRRSDFAQSLELVMLPQKQWRIELDASHYYNEIAEDTRKHYFLMDAEGVYTFPSGMELSLTAHNIFNNRVYGYTLLSSLTQQEVSYDIRPFEILLGLFVHF